ncbi:MAG TPA: SRPBCC family protein [Polyangiaceae bacterium]|nr:SRPBCC family protein [Polyangiaceae bacterium]
MTAPSVAHGTFVIERSFAASVERVFATWSNPEKKRRWFACHDDWQAGDYQLDFREGGVETNDVTDSEGKLHAFKGRYLDIVPNARIVYVYDMYVAGERLSVSLVTVLFAAKGQKTLMTFTEQVVFLDGRGDAAERREGTELGLARIDALV